MKYYLLLALVLGFIHITVSQKDYTFACGPMSVANGNRESNSPEKEEIQIGCNLEDENSFRAELKGAKGNSGIKGRKGTKGARGPYGNFGPQGPRGRPGEKGGMGAVGPKGDMGIAGTPGPKGEKGDPAEKLDRIEFENYQQAVDAKLLRLQETIDTLHKCCLQPQITFPMVQTAQPMPTPILEELETVDEDKCLLVYDDKCFKMTGERDVDRSQEQYADNCRELGGAPANIYDEIHYGELVDVIRAKNSPASTHVMLGMRYDVRNKKLLFSNMTEIPFNVQWRPYSPTTHPTHTFTRLFVTRDPTSSLQGLYNRAGNHLRHFGICEFALKTEGSGFGNIDNLQ